MRHIQNDRTRVKHDLFRRIFVAQRTANDQLDDSSLIDVCDLERSLTRTVAQHRNALGDAAHFADAM